MGTTIVPPPGRIRTFVTRKQILTCIHDDLEFAQHDADKAGDMEDVAYHQGRVDALHDIEYFMTKHKEK